MRDRRERIKNTPPWLNRKSSFRQRVLNLLIIIISWSAITVFFYVGFSMFFDTQLEDELKASYSGLDKEYVKLNERYDSIEVVLRNLEERDLNVFSALFESKPIDLYVSEERDDTISNDQLLTMTNKELGVIFLSKTARLDSSLTNLSTTRQSLIDTIKAKGDDVNNIPSIQPIINKKLTLLTASFGMRIHPFYKSLVQHNGVDYTVPEGTRVFVTADGVVKSAVSKKTSSTGLSVTIDHQNGYQTIYNHLSKITVRKGQKVRQGDIIALTGNSGLSLSPHLHYEITHNGEHIDPIHYFSNELSPDEYNRIIRIAQTGMQSFD